jgi:iron complex outermembrane receptor protein
MAAVDHIEVLTEGAATQYGSDAIAGVINIILKKNNSGGTVDATYGRFFAGDGNTGKVEANAGFAPTENSFFASGNIKSVSLSYASDADSGAVLIL